MRCDDVHANLPAYLGGELPQATETSLALHIEGCPSCRQALDSERMLGETLRHGYRIPAPSEGFQARVLSAAREQHRQRVSGRWSSTALGGAVAAALVLGLGLGILLHDPATTTDMAVQERGAEAGLQTRGPAVVAPVEKTVRLAFRSGEALENVTLTLELPPNVELAAWPGQRELSWQVSLEEGENVLSLPLKLLFPGPGELVAHLDTGERQKTFRAPIPRYPETRPEDSGS